MDLVIFAKEILNEKLHFLCIEGCNDTRNVYSTDETKTFDYYRFFVKTSVGFLNCHTSGTSDK